MKVSFFKTVILLVVCAIVLCCSCSSGKTGDTVQEPKASTAPVAEKPVEVAPDEHEATKATESEVVIKKIKLKGGTGEEEVVQKPAAEETKPAVEAPPAEEKPAVEEPAQKEPVQKEPAEKEPAQEEPEEEGPIVVATIEDYEITADEVEERLIRDLMGDPQSYVPMDEPITAETIVRMILAEKAMVIDGRRRGLADDNVPVQRYKQGLLRTLVLTRDLQGKITYTEEEIAEAMKANPKLKRAEAIAAVQRKKSTPMVTEHYEQLSRKRNVKKLTYNFPKVAQAHQRLLYRPVNPRKQPWIRNAQIEGDKIKGIPSELTQEERETVLVQFDGGQVTLLDWFRQLNQFSPPSRPKDLGTKEGVDGLVDRCIEMPLYVAEAKARGLDKDPEYIKVSRRREDRTLLSRVKKEQRDKLPDITDEEIRQFYEDNKEDFSSPDSVKIDIIWCENEDAARDARDEIDSGEDFEAVKQKYGLLKTGTTMGSTRHSDRFFFDRIWDSSDTIEGPLKGFYKDGVRWRVVKILERTEGKPKDYSSGVKYAVRRRISRQRNEELLLKYAEEELGKYEHKIYMDKVKAIDPFDVP